MRRHGNSFARKRRISGDAPRFSRQHEMISSGAGASGPCATIQNLLPHNK